MFPVIGIDTGDAILLGLGALAIVVLTLAIVGIVTMARHRHARTQDLQRRFGPEYEATVDELGKRKGQAELERRLDEYEELDLDRVPPSQRDEYSDRWREVQYRFIDTPEWSVREAEHLVVDVMRERGLPVDDVDSRTRALSVVDPDVSTRYRDAYSTFRSVEDGEHEIEAMYDALRCYRQAFESLLDRPKREASVAAAGPPRS